MDETPEQGETPEPWWDDVTMPALLRHSRTTYGSAIRSRLAEIGCEDVPANGIYVVGAIARDGSPLSEIITSLGMSKQAAGQLVDTLVLRGYLARCPDPEDRRRMTVSLTERGDQAAAATREAVDSVDAVLVDRVGQAAVSQARTALAALVEIGRSH